MTEILRRLFVHNFSLKFLSLVLAVVLFVLVRADKVVERTIVLDVVVTDNQAQTRKRVSEIPTSVKLRLRGRLTKLRELSRRRLPTYSINLSKRKNFERFYFDDTDLTQTLKIQGVSVVEIIPSSFTLRFDRIVNRKIPVRVRFQGSVPEGYLRSLATIAPKYIAVTGAESYVRQLRFVETEPIELSGTTSDISLVIGLESPTLSFVSYATKNVRVSVPITAKVGTTKKLVDVIVRNCSPYLRCTAKPSEVNVFISGPELKVKKLSALDVKRYVYIEGKAITDAGDQTLTLQINQPPGPVKFFTERTNFLVSVLDLRPKPKPKPVPKPKSEPQPKPEPTPLGPVEPPTKSDVIEP